MHEHNDELAAVQLTMQLCSWYGRANMHAPLQSTVLDAVKHSLRVSVIIVNFLWLAVAVLNMTVVVVVGVSTTCT